jgi:hypothetical protein
MKSCIRCGIMKPLDEFYSHPHMADKHLNVCKTCKRIDSKLYTATDAGQATERRRNQKPERQMKMQERAKQWNHDHPVVQMAHRKVYKMVRAGKLVKPDTCQDCGKVCDRIQAHHPDHNFPEKVEWLCGRCHGKRNPHYRTLAF